MPNVRLSSKKRSSTRSRHVVPFVQPQAAAHRDGHRRSPPAAGTSSSARAGDAWSSPASGTSTPLTSAAGVAAGRAGPGPGRGRRPAPARKAVAASWTARAIGGVEAAEPGHAAASNSSGVPTAGPARPIIMMAQNRAGYPAGRRASGGISGGSVRRTAVRTDAATGRGSDGQLSSCAVVRALSPVAAPRRPVRAARQLDRRLQSAASRGITSCSVHLPPRAAGPSAVSSGHPGRALPGGASSVQRSRRRRRDPRALVARVLAPVRQRAPVARWWRCCC